MRGNGRPDGTGMMTRWVMRVFPLGHMFISLMFVVCAALLAYFALQDLWHVVRGGQREGVPRCCFGTLVVVQRRKRDRKVAGGQYRMFVNRDGATERSHGFRKSAQPEVANAQVVVELNTIGTRAERALQQHNGTLYITPAHSFFGTPHLLLHVLRQWLHQRTH